MRLRRRVWVNVWGCGIWRDTADRRGERDGIWFKGIV